MGAVLLAAVGHPAAAQGCADPALVRRAAGESATAFATRIRPPDAGLVHPVLEGEFGVTPRDILALYGDRPWGLQHGWVLAPERGCPGSYRRHQLPVDRISLMEVVVPAFEVRAVLRANTDRDAAKELVLILFAEGRGPADDRGNRALNREYNVAVFDRSPAGFTYRYPVSAKLYNLPDATAVRRRLRSLGF